MKTRIIMGLMAIAIAGTISATTVQAQETPGMPTNMMNGQMNGHMMNSSMDMSKMHGMMKDCMSKNNDGKMCDKEAMQSCQKDMKMGDCQKMMNSAKKIK